MVTGGVGGVLISVAFMAAGSVVANQIAPAEQANKKDDSIQYTTTNEACVIPVVFGVCRLGAIQGQVDWGLMHSEDVETSGGKGGTGSGSGQKKYQVPFEHILAVDSLDGMFAVLTSNEKNLLPNRNFITTIEGQETTITVPDPVPFATDVMELSFDAGNDVNGVARCYRGSKTQTRMPSGDKYVGAGTGYNYRSFAWVLLGTGDGFWIGYSKNLPNFNYVVWRWPKPVLDNGDSISLRTKGSADPNHTHYYAANPAAVIWECRTNRTWGKGISSELMDQASFRAVSEYCEKHNYGVNIKLDSRMTLDDVEKVILNCYKLRVVQENGKYKLLNLSWLPDADILDVPNISESEFVNGSLEFVTTDLEQTKNWVQVTYTNPMRNWKSSSVKSQNDANIALRGRIEPHTVNLSPITDQKVAQEQANRICKEMSHLAAVITFEANRSKYRLQLGDVVGFGLTRYQNIGGKILKILCRVSDIKDSSSEKEVLKYTLTEDYHWPRVLVDDIKETVQPYVEDTEDQPNIPTWRPPDYSTGPVEPLIIFEPPAVMTNGQKLLAFLGEKPGAMTEGIAPYWSPNGAAYKSLSSKTGGFAITGTLLSLPSNRTADRSSAGFTVRFTTPSRASSTMSSACKVPDATVSFTDLVAADTDFLVIGDEVIQVGLIEQVDATTWRVRNYLRGRFNTRRAVHQIGAVFAYVQTLSSTFAFQASVLPDMSAPRLRGYPVAFDGLKLLGADKSIYHAEAEYNGKFLGRAARPLAPEFLSKTANVIKVAPRLIGSKVPQEFLCQPPQVIDLSFLIEQRGSGTVLSSARIAPSTYVPAVPGQAETGITLLTTPDAVAGADTYRIYSQDRAGLRSAEYIDVPIA